MIEGTDIHKLLLDLKKVGYKQIMISKNGIRAYPDYSARDLPMIKDRIALWELFDKHNYSMACGNGHQCQANFYIRKGEKHFIKEMLNIIICIEKAGLKGFSGLNNSDVFGQGHLINLEEYKPLGKALSILYVGTNEKE